VVWAFARKNGTKSSLMVACSFGLWNTTMSIIAFYMCVLRTRNSLSDFFGPQSRETVTSLSLDANSHELVVPEEYGDVFFVQHCVLSTRM